MTKLFDIFKSIFPRKPSDAGRYNFMQIGFHGDLYLLDLVDAIIKRCHCFVETGSNVGSTLAYVAQKYPGLRCYSCEPDNEAFDQATKNTAQYNNVSLSHEMSQSFISDIANNSDIVNTEVLFWLDAHGYGYKWPLLDEIDAITSNFKKGYILIDDFLVPGLECFGYDEYDGQICSFDYIKESLKKQHKYKLYYPAYTDKTSKNHPLRGWALLEFGHFQELNIPDSLKGKIEKHNYFLQ